MYCEIVMIVEVVVVGCEVIVVFFVGGCDVECLCFFVW